MACRHDPDRRDRVHQEVHHHTQRMRAPYPDAGQVLQGRFLLRLELPRLQIVTDGAIVTIIDGCGFDPPGPLVTHHSPVRVTVRFVTTTRQSRKRSLYF